MANYLVASGSRKISQLEIATEPVPAGSSSVMPLVIGDSIPVTNGTTVQITPDNFLSSLVFDAAETYTNNNTFSGANTFSGNNTFTSSNNSFNDGNTYFNNSYSSVPYRTILNGGRIELYENDSNFDTLRIRVDSGNGILFEDANFPTYNTFLEVQPSQGDIHLKRNTVISGSLTVQEVFYVYETASVLNSSGSSKVGDSGDDTHQFSGSILLSGSLSIIDGATLDGVDLSVFSSSVQAESQSFASRVTQNEDDITLLSASFEATSSQIFDDVDYLSGSYETFSGSQYQTDSASFSADITQNEGDILLLSSSYETFSGSQYQTDSGSFSTRVTTNETDISNLQTDSGSFSTRVTQNEGDISLLSSSYETFSGSQYNTDSGSFSADITENSQSLSLLSGSFLTASGSFSTRVTQNESDISQNTGDISILSASFETTSSKLIDASGSFSTRVTNNELTGSDHEDRIVNGTNAVTSSAVSSSYIDLDVLANGDVPAHKAGRLFFGSEDGALNVYNEEADFTLQVGQEFVVRAFNKSGAVIENGTPVYASGSQGDRIGVYPATAEDHTSGVHYDNHILGIVTHEIGISEEGYVTSQGIVRGVDTQNFTEGDILYLQTGSPATVEDYYRNTPPPFPYDIVQVGYVARSAANGFILAEPKEPVHFNNISGLSGSQTPQVGDLWVYQPNNGWSTTHNLTGSYTIGGDLLPETTEIHDLGSPSLRWRDLYLSGSTIDLGGLLIQKGADGNVQFIDSASQATKSVTIDSITGSLIITGDLTASLPQGYTWVGGAGDTTILVETSSFSAGGSIFTQTGSYYSTPNDLQITGSIVVSNDITASKLLLNNGGNIFIGDRVGTQLDTVSSDNNVAIGTDALGGQSAVGSQNVDSSVAVGYNALYKVQTSGGQNVGIGYQALFDNTSGNNNTAVGIFAGSNIDIGVRNTNIGSNSGLAITSGNGNTTVGYLANVQNATDFNSIVIGSGSVGNGSNTVVIGNDNITSTELKGNVTASALKLDDGLDNILIGSQAGPNIGSGTYNVAIGWGAAESTVNDPDYSVSIGYLAGEITRYSNISIGREAGRYMCGGGDNNIAIGSYTGKNQDSTNIFTRENTVVGHYALGGRSTSSDTFSSQGNTAIGYEALSFNTTGFSNTAVGDNALADNLEGDQNTSIGNSSGEKIQGDSNATFGYRSGDAIISGSYNVTLGAYADVANSTDDNSITIGYSATGKGSNTGFIKPGTGGVYQGNNSSTWSTTSDERLKKNIVDNNEGFDKIKDIRVRNFEYRTEDEITELNPSNAIKKEGLQLGVIAQELQEVLPECVKQESTGVYSLETDNLIWYMINSIKEQQQIINDLKSRIETLENQ